MSKKSNITNLTEDTGKGSQVVLDKEEILLRKYFLKEKLIGISISESDNLEELGFTVAHLKDAMVEIARYILASGGKIAYGGDMRQGGFTELFFELLAYYKADKQLAPAERFFSYLAYPLSTTLTQDKEAELRQNVTFIKVSPPIDLDIKDPMLFLKPDTPENLYVWARCLTKMREEMERECHARIFIGGRTKEYKGKCPGVMEEFLIAVQNQHPIYLIGSFGGVTRDIFEAIQKSQALSFQHEYHLENKDYEQMFNLYNDRQKDNRINYNQFYGIAQNLGLEGLSRLNGLTEEENLRLSKTPHTNEIIYLILKGLTNCFTTNN